MQYMSVLLIFICHCAGRTVCWRHLINKSTSTGDGRQFRYLGWYVLNIRLRCQRLAAKGGRMECYYLWVHDRWLFGATEYGLHLVLDIMF